MQDGSRVNMLDAGALVGEYRIEKLVGQESGPSISVGASGASAAWRWTF